MERLRQLILAWAAGEDCYYQISDALKEMGYPLVAALHEVCTQPQYRGCYLQSAAAGRIIIPNIRPEPMSLEEYLAEEERRVQQEAAQRTSL